jgi:hypothetical protein
MNQNRRAAVIALLLLGLVGALWVACGRVAVERANRTVALGLDDQEVRQLAALTGQSAEALLSQLKAAGATHVAVAEDTVAELLQAGKLRPEIEIGDRMSYALPGPLAYQVAAAAKKVPGASAEVYRRPPGAAPLLRESASLVVPRVFPSLSGLGLGYDAQNVQAVKGAGLGVIARPAPDLLLNPQAVDISLKVAHDTGAKIVIFNGAAVAGGAKLAKTTAASLRQQQLQFGYVELVPMEGNAQLASALDYAIIRTHSISQEEMAKTAPSRGLDRFILAVTERNVRLCYVRLQLTPVPDIVGANCDYVRAIADAIRGSGYALGEPAPFAPLDLPRPALVLLGLGVLGGGLWLLGLLSASCGRCFWGTVVAGGLICVAGPFAAFGLMRVLVSLGAGVIFPALAVLHVAAVADPRADDAGSAWPPCPLLRMVREGSPARPWLGASGLVVRAALITLTGGLMLAAALSSSDYLMQVAQFRGVKLAQLLPLLLVLGVTLARSSQAWRQAKQPGWPALKAGLAEAGEAVVRYWHAIVIMVALGALAFMVMRSGNESAIEVPAFELKLRALLDHVLLVRPRTKEILLGYPALMVGLMLLLRGRPRFSWVLLAVGAISQISLLNTCCHLHTPLLVSLLRIANGLWLGLVVGAVWWGARSLGQRVLQRVWWPPGP